jgi:hypothetical protein
MAKYRASEPERGSVPRLFISSTVEDLRAYREGVRDAAVAAEMLPKMLEYFPAAGDRLPLDTCLDEVSAADLLAVIVAHRYGWVPPDQPGDEYKSITWLECERAVAEGREVLAFLVDDRQPWPDDQREEQAILAAVRQGTATPELLSTVQRNVARLRDFKAWLSSRRIRTTFTTPDDLRARVAEALHDWRRRRLPGRSAEPASRAAVADPGPYLRELRDDTAQIDIRGLQVGAGKANRFAIEDLYISLSAAGGWETGRRTPGGRPADAGGRARRKPTSRMTARHGRPSRRATCRCTGRWLSRRWGRKFPWGNQPADASRLNFDGNVGHVTPVGIYPLGNTPEGICDIASNVAEWCSDVFAEDYRRSPKKNPTGSDKGDYRVLRGGAWDDSARDCRAAVRYRVLHPVLRGSVVGFRLCLCRQNSPVPA